MSHHRRKNFFPLTHTDRKAVYFPMDRMLKPGRREEDLAYAAATVGSPLGYYRLEVCFRGPMGKPGGLSESAMMASFLLTADVSFLFPYINAVAKRAELYQEPRFIRFMHEDRFCVLYPEAGLISPVDDRSDAASLVERLMAFLRHVSLNRHRMIPSPRVRRRVSVLDILKLLPKTNCRKCGYASCMAFAASLSLKEAFPQECPHMGSPVVEQALYPVYDQAGNICSTVVIDIDTTMGHPKDRPRIESQKTRLKASPSLRRQKGDEANQSTPIPLTSRELEVLRILARGASNNEISQILEISPHTVKSHVIHIFNKLGVNDRTQAAVWAACHNLI